MEIGVRSLISKLVLLCLHFPTMRICWSRDAFNTVSMFQILKRGQLQPELEHALTSGVVTESPEINELADIMKSLPANAPGEGSTAVADDDDSNVQAMAPIDILRRLPGVNATNMRLLIEKVDSLSDLSTNSLEELSEWMGSAVNAKKLHRFLHANVSNIAY